MLSIIGWQIWMSWISDVKSTRQGCPKWCTVSFLCRFQNGSTALHAAVMGGNIRTVLLLLCANADPNLRNKVRHLPVDLDENTHTRHYHLSLFIFIPCVLQNNELPSDLTKSDRILKVLHPRVINGDSWLPPRHRQTCRWCADNVYWGETKKTTTLCQTYPATICTVKRPYCCHMLIKPGLNLSNWLLHLSAMCILSLMLLYNNIFFLKLECLRYFAHVLVAFF